VRRGRMYTRNQGAGPRWQPPGPCASSSAHVPTAAPCHLRGRRVAYFFTPPGPHQLALGRPGRLQAAGRAANFSGRAGTGMMWRRRRMGTAET
jgi:hypothetical protein